MSPATGRSASAAVPDGRHRPAPAGATLGGMRRRRRLVRRLSAAGLVLGTVGALLAGCGSPARVPAAVARCPLTWLPAPGGVVPRRAALAVKIGNDPAARPQSGLSGADIVIEEPIEGAMTRLIALYQCHQAAEVGPVRSTRWTDTRILGQFGRAGFAFAGGTTPEEDMVRSSPLVDLSVNAVPGAYHRIAGRRAPENLYTSTAALWADVPGRAPPQPVFRYGRPLLTGTPVTAATLAFSSSFAVQWRWDPGRRTWIRWVGGRIDRGADGHALQAANVVIEDVATFPGIVEDALGSRGVNSVTTGHGEATVLTRGHATAGTWSRGSVDEPARLTAAGGRPLVLAPGVTWIELLPVGGVVAGSLALEHA